MSANDLTPKQMLEALEAFEESGGIKTAAAQILGLNRNTYVNRLNRAKVWAESPEHEEQAPPASDKLQSTEDRAKGTATIVVGADHPSNTVEDAIKQAGFDPEVWEAYRIDRTEGTWDVTMKMKRQGKDDKAEKHKNHQIKFKIFLRRKVSYSTEIACNAIMERMAKHAPKYKKLPAFKSPTDPHLLEISVFDHHFGKLAWAMETGQNYDLHIAEELYVNAVEDLLSKSAGYNVEKILFPIGQDFFHIDNISCETVNGTSQDTEGRYAKIFEVGAMACVKALDLMRLVAPVDVLWVPGNHDRTTSYHLARELAAWYRTDDRITFHLKDSLRTRKFYPYGNTLIGFTHGSEEKVTDLPAIMATEVPDLWAASRHREWHLGHFHKKKEIQWVDVDEHTGVRVRFLPSLSGRDYWHYLKGYVGSMRAAEAYVYSKERAYAGHFSATV